jgi:hypothetical protein
LDNVTAIVVRALAGPGGMLERLLRRWSKDSHPDQSGQS